MAPTAARTVAVEIQIASDLQLEMYAAQQPAPGGYRSATDARGRPCAPEGGPVYPPIQAFTQVPGLDLAGDVGTGDLAREFVERELAPRRSSTSPAITSIRLRYVWGGRQWRAGIASVAEFCRELGGSRATLYSYVEPQRRLPAYRRRVLEE